MLMATDTEISHTFTVLEGSYNNKDNTPTSNNELQVKSEPSGKPPRHLSTVRHSMSSAMLVASADLDFDYGVKEAQCPSKGKPSFIPTMAAADAEAEATADSLRFASSFNGLTAECRPDNLTAGGGRCACAPSHAGKHPIYREPPGMAVELNANAISATLCELQKTQELDEFSVEISRADAPDYTNLQM
nr:probable protein phosphatase 2C 27 [Ipomoea batatas]